MLPTQQLKTAAALTLALAAIAPATAAASPARDAGRATQNRPQTTPIVRVITPPSGFSWGDAAIGAAGGLALSLLGVGGTLAISSARTRRSNIPAAPTS